MTLNPGYRYRPLDTRVGTIDVAIPKLRSGTYFPEWLLQRRKRSENALITVVADCYLAGVSTRRMDKLVKTLGITGLSKSQVSRMAADLDEHVDEFRHRPLNDAGPFTFVAADALTMKVREGGRVDHHHHAPVALSDSTHNPGTQPAGCTTQHRVPEHLGCEPRSSDGSPPNRRADHTDHNDQATHSSSR